MKKPLNLRPLSFYLMISGLAFFSVVTAGTVSSVSMIQVMKKKSIADRWDQMQQERGLPPTPPPPPLSPLPEVFGLVPEVAAGFVLVAIALLGFGVAAGMALYFLRAQLALVSEALSRLQAGELDTRIAVSRDPTTLAVEFNTMAAEIQNLVEHVRETEKSRRHILQELSHDLGTPVASLRGLIENVRDHQAALGTEKVAGFLQASLIEIEYLQRLLSDLVFIAGGRDHSLARIEGRTDLVEALLQEIEILSGLGRIFRLEGPDEIFVCGDELLLKRLLSNALSNAGRYAKAQVRIMLGVEQGSAICIVEDDGEGISDEEIKHFGEKKAGRRYILQEGGHLSMGLGSVIMKKIVVDLGGTLRIERLAAPSGTRLTLQLPLARLEAKR